MKKYVTIIIALISILAIGQAYAKQADLPFTYSVKYLCGLQRFPSQPPFEPPVKQGNYATAINIHNYHETPIVIFKKAVIANGVIGPITTQDLKPNQAINIDCTKIARSIPSGLPPFIEGFFEIKSSVQLSVAAVYTSKGCRDPECTTFGDLALNVVPHTAFTVQ